MPGAAQVHDWALVKPSDDADTVAMCFKCGWRNCRRVHPRRCGALVCCAICGQTSHDTRYHDEFQTYVTRRGGGGGGDAAPGHAASTKAPPNYYPGYTNAPAAYPPAGYARPNPDAPPPGDRGFAPPPPHPRQHAGASSQPHMTPGLLALTTALKQAGPRLPPGAPFEQAGPRVPPGAPPDGTVLSMMRSLDLSRASSWSQSSGAAGDAPPLAPRPDAPPPPVAPSFSEPSRIENENDGAAAPPNAARLSQRHFGLDDYTRMDIPEDRARAIVDAVARRASEDADAAEPLPAA